MFQTVAGLRTYLEQFWEKAVPCVHPPGTVGLVPTMGALHAGHLSLIQRARQENALVVVSIFVNPLQFGANEDFHHYPKTLAADQILCKEAGVDVIFAPSVAELYHTEQPTTEAHLFQVIPPTSMMAELCGKFRPGHFEGVATVVTKLFSLIQPDRAYFGQKDAQQLAILRRMVQDLSIPVDIVACPTVRESDGLAMSSRNRYLSAEERAQAPRIYQSLQQAEALYRSGIVEREPLLTAVQTALATTPSIKPQYIDLVDPITMTSLQSIQDTGLLAIAAHLGSARLIDNVLLRTRKPIIAIDGPAGSGKSTVTPKVAQQLGLLYLDTGAMYRAVTWLVLDSGIAVEDEAAIAELVSQCKIRLERQDLDSGIPTLQVWINDVDVTTVIRTPNVTAQVSAIAAQKAVRQALMKQQQEYGQRGGVVMDGRDIGTHVFPDAELKIFLTASVQERARRRQLELKERGLGEFSLEELEKSIYERDLKDSSRAIAPLRKAADAIEINTDQLTAEAVIEQIIALYCEKVDVQPAHETAV
nr:MULTISPECIES: bifunctional pantoate--beta-alanine ligase/(d)CMP kinase [unclassified Leptolyngbya]